MFTVSNAEFCFAKLRSLKSAWMPIALGGTDAAVSSALGWSFAKQNS